MTRKLALSLVLVLAAGSAALAATYDGDGNPVPGAYSVGFGPQVYAATRLPRQGVAVRAGSWSRYPSWTGHAELDGDGNPIPGR